MIKFSENSIRWILIAFSVLILSCFILFQTQRESKQNIERLVQELEELRNKEKQSLLIQRVSKQMEEIAYQQKEVSEKRRLEAVVQTQKANQMQQQAETEREKALTAQIEAEKAYRLADSQKKLAVEKQQQAEYSKKVADTLAFLALGRSLGSLSSTQYLSGNVELASLLAYAAWKFTRIYGGDIYQPAIFNALSQSCKQNLLWFNHKGAISGIMPLKNTEKDSLKEFITISKYGEIARWEYDGLQTCTMEFLINNPMYDFRFILSDIGQHTYILSFNGYIISLDTVTPTVRPLPKDEYKLLIPTVPGELMIVATHNLYSFDCSNNRIQICYTPDALISYAGKSGDRLYIFLNDGRTAIFSPERKFIKFTDSHLEKYVVTAFCPLSEGSYAIGCQDGSILICDMEGIVIQKLIGHQATVTTIYRKDNKLFSGSYDSTLRLWDLRKEKNESAVILDNTVWIHTFYPCPDGKYIFMGDEQGKLQRIPVSPDHMAIAIRQELQRDFTQEEWDYYIGNQIPFESYRPKTLRP